MLDKTKRNIKEGRNRQNLANSQFTEPIELMLNQNSWQNHGSSFINLNIYLTEDIMLLETDIEFPFDVKNYLDAFAS